MMALKIFIKKEEVLNNMNFANKVYELCKKIPRGKISSYKEIAHALNSKAYRAVGNALNKNPYKNVPCHRVVNSFGHLHGFARGLKAKAELLKKENIKIKNNKVLNFKEILYRFK